MSLAHEMLVASLESYVAANLPALVTTNVRYGGEGIDTGAISEWCDLMVPRFSRFGQRKTALDQRTGTVTVRIFVKDGADRYRVLTLSEAFTTLLRHSEIPIYDYDLSGPPQIGCLRLYEPTRRDETRRSNDGIRSDTRMILLQFSGYAQEV